jgi:hypothetical protein
LSTVHWRFLKKEASMKKHTIKEMDYRLVRYGYSLVSEFTAVFAGGHMLVFFEDLCEM